LNVEEAKSIAILGRQPALGIAELESLYGADHTLPYGNEVCLLDLEACAIDFNRLGGSMRVGTVLLKLPSTKWSDIENLLLKAAPEHAAKVEGKLSFGISVFGIKVSPKQVAKTALLMKKSIKNSGKSVRMVPHKAVTLGSAVVLHNKLHRSGNWELLIISDGQSAYLAQTNFIQDIDAYSARDQARPMRDAKVGMLPPKLAQIITNLACGKIESGERRTENDETTILDPFCGTGVLLQEAALMGLSLYGSDIEPKMIDYTRKNLQWLEELRGQKYKIVNLETADATNHNWSPTPDIVAAETFLGHPLSALPNGEHLSKIIYEANIINHRFLQNIASQLKPGTRLALGMPVWKGRHEFLHLPLLDHLTDMGYTRLRLKHVADKDLIYHRENQIVGRELLVLEKR